MLDLTKLGLVGDIWKKIKIYTPWKHVKSELPSFFHSDIQDGLNGDLPKILQMIFPRKRLVQD